MNLGALSEKLFLTYSSYRLKIKGFLSTWGIFIFSVVHIDYVCHQLQWCTFLPVVWLLRTRSKEDQRFWHSPFNEHCWRMEEEMRAESPQFPKLQREQKAKARHKLNKHSALCNRNQIPILNLIVYTVGWASRFPISFQDSWKNLELIFVLKCTAKIEFHVYATGVM